MTLYWFALSLVLLISVAILGYQIMRWLRGFDPFGGPLSDDWVSPHERMTSLDPRRRGDD